MIVIVTSSLQGNLLTEKKEMKEGMLSGYRILDLTDEKGVLCGKLLGDLGADVIKIERPGGDSSRNMGPFFKDDHHPEKSLYWYAYNSSKRGITLNIETRDGAEIFRKLLKTADVVLESFTPGYLDKLGFGYSSLSKIHPSIILTSITPFGQSGPYSEFKGADIVCWALSGKLLLTGDADRPPVHISHVPHSWFHGSADGAVGTAMALFRRGISGNGQQVDVSIQESMEKVGYLSHLIWTLSKEEAWRGPMMKTPPKNTITHFVWECKDGFVLFYPFSGPMGPAATKPVVDYMQSEGMADEFIAQLDWSQLDWGETSQSRADKIQSYFTRFFKSKTKDELFNESLNRRLMIQPINTPRDILEHPQLQSRQYWQAVEHPDLNQVITYPGGFIRSSETSCETRRCAPLIGEHNHEIYKGELNLSASQLGILKQAGVI